MTGIEPTEKFKNEFSKKDTKKETTSEWCGRIIREIVQLECLKVEKEKQRK